jgi:hypothetical protein
MSRAGTMENRKVGRNLQHWTVKVWPGPVPSKNHCGRSFFCQRFVQLPKPNWCPLPLLASYGISQGKLENDL